jgi:hypothetical protein
VGSQYTHVVLTHPSTCVCLSRRCDSTENRRTTRYRGLVPFTLIPAIDCCIPAFTNPTIALYHGSICTASFQHPPCSCIRMTPSLSAHACSPQPFSAPDYPQSSACNAFPATCHLLRTGTIPTRRVLREHGVDVGFKFAMFRLRRWDEQRSIETCRLIQLS